MDNFEHIDNIFKDGLDNLQVTPPAAAWDNIAPLVKKKRNIAFVLIRSIAAAAIVAMGIFLFTTTKNTTTKDLAITTDHKTDSEEVTPVIKHNPTTTSPETENNVVPIQENIAYNLDNAKNGIPIEEISPTALNDTFSHTADPLEYLASITPGTFKNNISPQLLKAEDKFDIEASIINYNLQFASTYLEADNTSSDNKMSISIAGQASPIIASVQKPAPMNTSTLNSVQPQKSTSEDLRAYSAGFSIALNTPGRFSVRTGIMYTQMGSVSQTSEIFELNSAFKEFSANTMSDNIVSADNQNFSAYIQSASRSKNDESFQGVPYSAIVTEETNNLELIENMEYVEVPVTMSYKFIDRKIDFNISGGLATNFLVGTTVITSTNRDNTNNVLDITDQVDKVKFATNLGIGMEYPLLKNFTLLIEPTLKYYIPSSNEMQTSQIKPFAMGIYTGINYRF